MTHTYFRRASTAKPLAIDVGGDRTVDDVVRYPNWLDYAGYGLFHVAAIGGAAATGVSLQALLICAACYLFAMMGISIAYHRYFAHKAFKTSRAFQFVLGVWGSLAVEKGPLWWASAHRHHHRYSDTANDIHSPLHRGYLFAHSGWFLDRRIRHADFALCPEFARYRELVWLDRWNWIPVTVYAGLLYFAFGLVGLVWGFFVATVAVWHMTHLVGSILHGPIGYRRFATPDNSRNSLLLALPLLGEGFHNNHHCFPYSARCGLAWWEVDINWWVIRALAAAGLVWSVRVPPGAVLARSPVNSRTARAHADWMLTLRGKLVDAMSRAAGGPDGERDFDRDRLAGRLENRMDTLDAAQQAALLADPVALGSLFAEFRDDVHSLVGDWQAGGDSTPGDALSTDMARLIDEAVDAHPSRHLFATGVG